MRSAPASAARRLFLVLGLPLALAALARAGAVEQPVHEIRIGADTVVGTLSAPKEVRRIPFSAVEGSVLDATLLTTRGGPLKPRLVLLGTDRLEDKAATAAMVRSPKGDRVVLAGYLITTTGRYVFEVRGEDDSVGVFTLVSRCRVPSKAAGSGSVVGGGDPAEFAFVAPGGATGTISVKAAGTGAAPTFAGLVGPDDQSVLVRDVRAAATGFSLRDVPLVLSGRYRLLVGSPAGADGGFAVKASFKTAKVERRTIDADRIIADPVLVSVQPDRGNPDETIDVTLHVDFAAPGAEVRLLRPPFARTIPSGSVTVVGDEARFALDLSPFPEGIYDIEIVNPDEGIGRLEDCFVVGRSPPVPQYISPNFGYDDEVVRSRVTGQFLAAGATVALDLDGDRIEGGNVVVASGSVSADFDLRGRAIGLYDVEIVNPGASPAILEKAFEVRKTPFLAAMDPTDNLDGTLVEARITGKGFEAGAKVSLFYGPAPGSQALPGTDVVVVSSEEILADFDTTGSPLGSFDLVLEYAGGRTARLADAFHTVGRPAPTAQVLTLSPPGDAPVAAAYNEVRNEYLVGWVVLNPNGWMVTFTVFVQRTDASGTPIGTPVSVSTGPATFPKGDPALSYDPFRDEYLVVWAEAARVTPTQNGEKHPNGEEPNLLAQVMAQRLKGTDLSAIGVNRLLSDHTAFPASGKTQWYVGDFDNFRPAAVFDRGRGVHEVTWMQQFDVSGLYSSDDYNVFSRRLDPITDALGEIVEVAIGPYHEGDPSLAWDDTGTRVLLAFNARTDGDGTGLDVLLGTGGKYAVVARGERDDLADPCLAVDAATDRVLVTFTRISVDDGLRTARAVVVDREDLATVYGGVTDLSESSAETLHVRPVGATHLKKFLVTWTEMTPVSMAVRQRYVGAAGSGGIVFAGPEEETSGGSMDEGISTAVYGPGEEAVFFLKTMSLTTRFVEYVGDVYATGSYAAGAVLVQRFK